MKTKSLMTFGIALLSIIFIAGAQLTASAQGRGRGGGNPGGGPPGGSPGVGGGIGTASGRSGGRSDAGLGNASGKSGRRSDDGLNRARTGGDAPRTDKDLNKFHGIANKLNTTQDALRTQYQAALAANPNLRFGQFVAANVIASNLNATHPNITTAAILSGLQSGKSIGQTLQDLGLSSNEAKAAEKEAKREVKHNGQ